MALPIYLTSASKQARLGEEYTLGSDRVFRYAKNGPEALVVGTVLQGPRFNDSYSNMVVNAAAAVDATSVTVILAYGDPLDRDQFKEGYLYTNDQAGEGFLYEITGHPGGGGEDVTKKIDLKDHLVAALTTSSQATLIPNPYSGVNKPGGDPFDVLVGVVPVAVPSEQFFWAQVRGPAVVLQDGPLFAGRGVMASQEVPGAVSVLKQVVPSGTGPRGTRMLAGVETAPSVPGAQKEYSQKALARMTTGTGRFDEDSYIENFSGKATIPERPIGYCINPRVSTEHALVYLTLS